MQTHNKQYQNNVMKCDMTWPRALVFMARLQQCSESTAPPFASDNIKLTVTMSY